MPYFNLHPHGYVPPCVTHVNLVNRDGGHASLLRALRAALLFAGLASGLCGFSGAANAQASPATRLEVAFSPREGAADLVLKVLSTARRSLRIAAYSFTSPAVAKEVVAAKKRGVDVMIVVDHKMNTEHDKFSASRAALDLIATAGVEVRTVDFWPMHHDKYIVADSETVETGSYNFSTNATKSRENVLVIWNNEALARAYEAHWAESWAKGRNYLPRY